MLKLKTYPKPLFTLEALNLLKIMTNHIELSDNTELVDLKRAGLIKKELEDIMSNFELTNPYLYHFFKNTKTNLASCLLNSFNNIFEMETPDFKNSLLKKLAAFKTLKIKSVELGNRLNIVPGEENYLLDELLKLKIDDHDLLMLIKALNNPEPYLDMIFKDIACLKEPLEKIYQKLGSQNYLDYFNAERLKAILNDLNIGYSGEVCVFFSLCHFSDMNIILRDDYEDMPLSICVGLALDLGSINNYHFLDDDLNTRLENFIKVINDPSKLKIIELLKEEDMYGAELAQKLNLKTSTISYHIDALMNSGIIKARREDKRIYYEYDKKSALKIIDHLRKKFI